MVIKKNKDEFLSYLEDTSNLKGDASLLFIPEDEKEVSDVLLQAAEEEIPLTISAAGTGTTGARVPLEGAVLSLENLNRIKELDKKKSTIVAEAGVTLERIEEEANKQGLTLRSQPTEPLAFIGGVVSTCASGPRSFKYGSIRDYVKRIKMAMTNGDIWEIERGSIFAKKRKFRFKIKGREYKFNLPTYHMPKVKSSAGYFVDDDMDLIDLFIGQEGTLSCILEVELLLHKKPYNLFDGIVFFDAEEKALEFVERIKQLRLHSFQYPCVVEFFDFNSLEFLRPFYSFIPRAQCAVYFEQEIDSEQQADLMLDYWYEFIEKSGASIDKCWFAETEAERQKLYQFRHHLPQAVNEYLRKYSQTKEATDIAVPDDKFHLMYYFYKEVALRSRINYVNFGHIGQNHLHFNFLPQNREESFLAKGYIMEFIEKAIALGGTISAEHGIGKIKKPYLEIMYGRRHLEEMAELKKMLDPACILGLDNIFDRKLLKK